MDATTIALVFGVIYFVGGGIYFCVSSYREERKGRKEAETKLEQANAIIIKQNQHIEEAEENLKQAHLIIDNQNKRINDLEAERTESIIVDYSIMAGLIEEHTTELADIHKWMDEHEAQSNALSAIRIQIVVPHAPHNVNYDYAGVDECNENPYPEPEEETPLPDWLQDAQIEGLDELK